MIWEYTRIRNFYHFDWFDLILIDRTQKCHHHYCRLCVHLGRSSSLEVTPALFCCCCCCAEITWLKYQSRAAGYRISCCPLIPVWFRKRPGHRWWHLLINGEIHPPTITTTSSLILNKAMMASNTSFSLQDEHSLYFHLLISLLPFFFHL